jgi:hypothetical protein
MITDEGACPVDSLICNYGAHKECTENQQRQCSQQEFCNVAKEDVLSAIDLAPSTYHVT